MITWQVGSYLMDTLTPDANGVVWSAAVQGWDSPDTDEQWNIKPNDDGYEQGSQFYSGRDVTLTIWAECPTEDIRRLTRQQFMQAFDLGKTISITSRDGPEQWSVNGVRYGKLLIRTPVPNKLDISMVVRCKDPLKYGPSSSISLYLGSNPPGLIFKPGAVFPLLLGSAPAGNSVNNTGARRTPPIITFFGPLTGPFWISNDTQFRRLAYNLNLGNSDVLVVDMKKGTAILNGLSSVRGYQTFDSRMFYLEPGINQLSIGASSLSAGYATVTSAPATIG